MHFRVPPDNVRKSFQTYSGYVANLALKIREVYASDDGELYANVYDATQAVGDNVDRRNLTEQQKEDVRRHLRASLSNLICVERESRGDEFFEASNAWTPVQAWYAVHHAMCALCVLVAGSGDASHARSVKVAGQLTADRGLFPYPWSAYVQAEYDGEVRAVPHNFHGAPEPLSNLSGPALEQFEDHLYKMLKTTIEPTAKDKIAAARKRGVAPDRTYRQVQDHEKKQICERIPPQTIFDALYRLRCRANYGDIDTFVIGAVSEDEALRFSSDLRDVADATVAAIESILAKYCGTEILAAVVTTVAARHPKSAKIAARLNHHSGAE